MLAQHCRGFLIALLSLLLAACGPTQTPEAQVRSVIAAGEAAAEARDLSALMELVATDFRDDQVGGREELQQYLRGYLVMHQSIHLLTRIESIDFPYSDMARVHVTVGSLASETGDSTSFDLAADVQELDLQLVREGEHWRVRRASRSQ